MKRTYNFEWYPTKDAKYGEPIVRHSTILLNKPIGITSRDAKEALNIFMKANGNLKRNTIVKIKEFGENGQIGEDIVPMEGDNTIIPVAK